MPSSSLRHQFFNYVNGCAFATLSMCHLMAFAVPKNQTVDLSSVTQNIKILASDAFEGRGPLTQGERLTIEYLAQQYKKLGLKGANPNRVGSSPLGQYFQAVPIAQIIPDQNMKLVIGDLSFTSGKDFTAGTEHIDNQITLDDSPLVFVGYGINAP